MSETNWACREAEGAALARAVRKGLPDQGTFQLSPKREWKTASGGSKELRMWLSNVGNATKKSTQSSGHMTSPSLSFHSL